MSPIFDADDDRQLVVRKWLVCCEVCEKVWRVGFTDGWRCPLDSSHPVRVEALEPDEPLS